MRDTIKIEVSTDEAECIYRALDCYVDEWEMKGSGMIVSFPELLDLAKQDPDEFGAGDRVAEYEVDLARKLLKMVADLVYPDKEGEELN